MRREFEMTQAQLEVLLEACRPVPYMVIGGHPPPSTQENANRAWCALGKELGFDGMSVRPSTKGERFFTAEVAEITEPAPGGPPAIPMENSAMTEMTEQQNPEQTELTYGQKAVGVSFNPSGDPDVALVKQQFADIIDALAKFRLLTPSGEAKRHASIAITEAETAQMRAVKALTWRD